MTNRTEQEKIDHLHMHELMQLNDNTNGTDGYSQHSVRRIPGGLLYIFSKPHSYHSTFVPYLSFIE